MLVRCLVPCDPAVSDQVESRPVEIAQAVILGVACVLCLVAMVRGGAGWSWWVGPAFICFFMCWREAEIDGRYLRYHAFSWKYLVDSRLSIYMRLLMGIPSLATALAVVVICMVRARRLLALLRRRELRVGIWLFAAGLGFYLVAQGYDRAWGWAQHYGVHLPGFAGHRDDFWEEWFELIGAAAILMGVLNHFRRRAAIGAAPPPDTPAAAEEASSP